MFYSDGISATQLHFPISMKEYSSSRLGIHFKARLKAKLQLNMRDTHSLHADVSR